MGRYALDDLTTQPLGDSPAHLITANFYLFQGSGIGRATALAFSRAGAKKIILIGRNEHPLKETQQALDCESAVHAADVTDEKALVGIAAATGTWDILILAAGYLAGPASIREASVDDWWKSFEVCYRPRIPIPYRLFLILCSPEIPEPR